MVGKGWARKGIEFKSFVKNVLQKMVLSDSCIPCRRSSQKSWGSTSSPFHDASIAHAASFADIAGWTDSMTPSILLQMKAQRLWIQACGLSASIHALLVHICNASPESTQRAIKDSQHICSLIIRKTCEGLLLIAWSQKAEVLSETVQVYIVQLAGHQ